jgi:hypothetical protein
MTNQTEKKLNMLKGTKLVCTDNQTPQTGTVKDKEYVFVAYDETSVPKNRQNAVMTWYPDKPIWTPEQYAKIRYRFMQIKLEGVEKPQWLRDFKFS